MIRRILRPLGMAFILVIAVATSTALAYLTSEGGGTASAAISQLNTPTITTANPGVGGTVLLKWQAVTSPDGSPVTYFVKRNGGDPGGNCPLESKPQESVTTCTDSGLEPGTYSYRVFASWSTWTKKSAIQGATVAIGQVTNFTVTTAGSTSPATGAGTGLTITAKDSNEETVTTFTGSHSLVFSGASSSPSGKAATASNSSGTAVAFGTATPITFTNGVASTISSTKNGVVTIYNAGEAKIAVTEGSLTTASPLVLNAVPAPSKFTITAASSSPTAGSPDALTIKATDGYGNATPSYAGLHSLVFSGASNGPNGNQPTVENSAGTPIAFGSATEVKFTNGVATVSESKNGEMVLYKSGSATVTAAEGSTMSTQTGATVTVAPATATSLTLTSSATTLAAGGTANLTLTAKDAYGNTATGYNGEKKITFSASGAAGEASPSGSIPGVNNNAGTYVPFGTATAITFAATGISSVGSSKNGIIRLYKAGTVSITPGDGTITGAPLTFTVTPTTAKKVAVTNLTASAGTISSPCLFACTVSGLTNTGQITASFSITDEFGNIVQNIGGSKSVALAGSGTANYTISPTSLTYAESGNATTTAGFTFKPPASGSYTDTVTATTTGYTNATITATK